MGSSAKTGGGQSTLKDYYSSEAAVIAVGNGKVYLESIYVDGERVWHTASPVDLSAQPVPYTVDVAGRGRMYIYSGSAAQVLSDPVLTKVGRDFSPMRNRIVVVFKDWLAGRERTSVPDFRLVIRRQPEQSIVTGPAALLDSAGQANEVAAAAELFTSEVHGAGIDASFIDQASWQAIADELLAESSNTYFSLVLRDKMTIDAVAQEIRGYNGVGFRPSRQGKIEAFRIRQGVQAPEGLPVVRSEDIEAGTFPEITAVLQQDMDSRFDLKWTNPALDFEEDPVRWENKLARARSSRKNPGSYSRPWILRGNQAKETVARLGQRDSTPYENIENLRIRETKADEISPGDLFILSLEDNGEQFVKICLMKEMSGWGDGETAVECSAETARGVFPAAGWEDFVEEEFEEDEPIEDLLYCNVLQATKELSGSKHDLFVLAARHQGFVTGFDTYLKAESVDFQFAGRSRSWAVAGTLQADYDSAQPLDDDSGNLKFVKEIADDPFGFGQLETVFTEDEYKNDRLLLVVIDSLDNSSYEVFSVKSMLSPVSGAYPLQALRSRRGTNALDHLAGDRCYLVYRESIDYITHSQIEILGKEEDPLNRLFTLRCVPYSFREILPIEDASDRTITLRETQITDPFNVVAQGIPGGFVISFSVAEQDIIGARIWISTTETGFSTEPTFQYAISHRELVDGKVEIPYLDQKYTSENNNAYFKIQIFDNEEITNYSSVVGPFYSGTFGAFTNGPRISLTSDQYLIYGEGTFRLSARVTDPAGTEKFTWHRYPINATTGISKIAGKTENFLEVPTSDILPSGTGPNFRKYRVQLNQAQYDEVTLWSYYKDIGTETPLYIVYQNNEQVTVEVDENYDMLPGQLGNTATITNNFVFVGIPGYVATPIAAADPAGPLRFHLVLPSGLEFIPGYNNGVRLINNSFLTAGDNSTTFNIEVWSDSVKIADLPFVVKKNQSVVAFSRTRMEHFSNDVSVGFYGYGYEQPITPTDHDIEVVADRGNGEILSTAKIYFRVNEDGTIDELNRTGDHTDFDWNVYRTYPIFVIGGVPSSRTRVHVEATHQNSGAHASTTIDAVLDVDVILGLDAGVGESLDILDSNFDNSNLALGEGEDGSTA